jgi:hypothetical protein
MAGKVYMGPVRYNRYGFGRWPKTAKSGLPAGDKGEEILYIQWERVYSYASALSY